MRNEMSSGLLAASLVSTTPPPRAYTDGDGVALVWDPKTRRSTSIALAEASESAPFPTRDGRTIYARLPDTGLGYQPYGGSAPFGQGSSKPILLTNQTAPAFSISTSPGTAQREAFLRGSDLYRPSDPGIRLTVGSATAPATSFGGSAMFRAGTESYSFREEKPRSSVGPAESIYLDTRVYAAPSGGVSLPGSAPTIDRDPLPKIGGTGPYTPGIAVYQSPIPGIRTGQETVPAVMRIGSEAPFGRVSALPAQQPAERSPIMSPGPITPAWKAKPAAPAAPYAPADGAVLARLSRIEAAIFAIQDELRRAQSPLRRGADAVLVEIAMEILKFAAPKVFRLVQIAYRLVRQ